MGQSSIGVSLTLFLFSSMYSNKLAIYSWLFPAFCTIYFSPYPSKLVFYNKSIKFYSSCSFPHVNSSANSSIISGIYWIGFKSVKLIFLLFIIFFIMVFVEPVRLSNIFERLAAFIYSAIFGIMVGSKSESFPNMFLIIA